MKRYRKGFIVVLAGAILVTLTGCTISQSRNPYDVATWTGYDGTPGEFLTQTRSERTWEYALFEDAKADGYEGSFVDFLKETSLNSESGVDIALMSAVSIVSNFQRTGSKPSLFGGSTEKYSSLGSGVIYSLDKSKGDAYLITNYHVIYNLNSSGNEEIKHISDDITVYLYGGEMESLGIKAQYVGGTMEYDLAVLKLENSQVVRESEARAAGIGNSDALTVGETVYAVGNPNAQGISAVSGIVSVEAEYIDIQLADESGNTNLLEIRTDAPINHGNSGGGLFDGSGNLIGIVNARSEASGVEGFGYAIPSNLAISVVQNIIDNSGVNQSRGAMRAMLGISVQVTDTKGVYDESAKKAYILETITVQSTEIGKIAFGKIKTGDIVISAKINDGEKVFITRMHHLTNLLFSVRKGDTVILELARGDETVSVQLQFTENADFTLYD